jgi:hypothetical protein
LLCPPLTVIVSSLCLFAVTYIVALLVFVLLYLLIVALLWYSHIFD